MQNPLNLLNEADVREDFIAPFLVELGYKRGTQFDILRERNLTYPRNFLGRKKKTDQPLVGKADYILSISGVGRWVIEAKPPGVSISRSDIEQALTYARHPEISAALCVVTNGLETHVYETNSIAGTEPVGVEIEKDPIALAIDLRQLLGPDGFAHRFRRRVIALRGGISRGLAPSCDILAGSATYRQLEVSHNLPPTPQFVAQIEELQSSMKGYVSHLAGGKIFVGDKGVHVLTDWSMPNEKMLGTSKDIGLGTSIEFLSLSKEISQDRKCPTFFDAAINLKVSSGMKIFTHAFDIGKIAGVNMNSTVSARAKASIDKNRMAGEFFTEYYFDFPDLEGIRISVEGFGDFICTLDL